MPYTTKTLIVSMIGAEPLTAITDDDNTGATVDSIVTQCITDADSTIDSYLGSRYTVPISPTPNKIAELSRDIAIYNLYSRTPQGPPEFRKVRYDGAIAFLKDVSSGKAVIDGLDFVGTDVRSTSTVSISSDTRIFTSDDMAGF